MKKIPSLVYSTVFALAVAILVVLLTSLAAGFNWNGSIDASSVNGLITATAIVFSFVSFEAREIEPFEAKVDFLIILTSFLLLTGVFYYYDVMRTGQPTKLVLLVTMADFYFNILSVVIVLFYKARVKAKT
jgi:hypothetical protein